MKKDDDKIRTGNTWKKQNRNKKMRKKQNRKKEKANEKHTEPTNRNEIIKGFILTVTDNGKYKRKPY